MAFEEVREIAAEQYGLFTTAQAENLDLTRLKVHRLARAGRIRQVRRGVYSTEPFQSDNLEDLRAAWLSLDPAKTVAERLADDACAVAATSSAAHAFGVGNLMTYKHEFFSPQRKQSRADDLHIRVRTIPAADLATVQGIRITTVTRTVLDLLADGEELEHVSALLLGAVQKNLDIDWQRLHKESARFEKVYGINGADIFSALFSAASNEVEQASFAQDIARQNFPGISEQVAKIWSQQLELMLHNITENYPTSKTSLFGKVAEPQEATDES